MAQSTPLSVDAIYINFLTNFQDALTSAEVWSDKVVTKIASASRENRYLWVDKIPRLRKWTGDRVYNSLSRRSYALVNDDYEDSLKLDRNVIDDDGLGLYAQGVRMLGDAAAHWPDDMVADIMQNGQSTSPQYICHDGQPFFSAAHPTNLDAPTMFANQTNLYSVATSGATPLNATNYNTVRAAMMALKGSDGKPLGIRPDLLVVAPALEMAAKQLLNADFIAPTGGFGVNAAAQQTNVLKGTADLLVIPQFAGADTTWYLLSTKGPLKPFIFQERKAPQFTVKAASNDDNMFDGREIKMGVDARGAAGFSLWFLAAKAVG